MHPGIWNAVGQTLSSGCSINNGSVVFQLSDAKSSYGHCHSFEQQNKLQHWRVKGICSDPGIGGVTLTAAFRVVATEHIPASGTASSLFAFGTNR